MAVYRPKYRDKQTGELVESEIWWYDFGFAGKRYRGPTAQTRKTLAGDFEKGERLKVERAYAGLPTEAPSQRIRTVSEALKAYQQGYETGHRDKSVSWVKERAKHLERLLGGAILPDLTETRIRAYIKTRLAERVGKDEDARTVGNRTVNMELLILSRAIGHTWRELWPGVRKLEEREDIGRALAPEEEAALLGAAAANSSPFIDRFIRIALTSAMRAGEIRTIQVGRLDFANRTLQVGRAKSRRGTGRVIPMNSDLYNLLVSGVAWLEETFGRVQPGWYLFPFYDDARRPTDPTRPVTTIKSAWESVRETSKVQCRFHDLRHTAITKLAEQGVPDSTMKALAGHVHEKMLERYSHIRMAAKRDAVEALALPKAVNAGVSKANAKANAKVSRKSRLSVVPNKCVSD
jgi:integrase